MDNPFCDLPLMCWIDMDYAEEHNLHKKEMSVYITHWWASIFEVGPKNIL
jgi:hypothetical protein